MNDLDLLHEVADVPRGDEVERRARAVAYARLRAAVAAPPRRRRRLGLGIGPLALAAGIAAAVVVIVAWPRAADVEREASPAVLPGPGQYFYSRLTVRLGDEPPRSRELWLAPDGTGELRDGDDTQVFGRLERWTTGGEPIDYDELLALPTDVDALARYVDENARGRDVHAEAEFMLVGELLRQTPVTPDQSRALFAVAERIPGVETAPAADPNGRRGVRVSYAVDPLRRDLVRDADGVLLADQLWSRGEVVESYVVEERAIVDVLGERP